MVGAFYCKVYEVVYIIRESTVTFCIQYIGSLYEVVYFIPVTAYTSNRLYKYPPHRIFSRVQPFYEWAVSDLGP
jgi:hypothetical protein